MSNILAFIPTLVFTMLIALDINDNPFNLEGITTFQTLVIYLLSLIAIQSRTD